MQKLDKKSVIYLCRTLSRIDRMRMKPKSAEMNLYIHTVRFKFKIHSPFELANYKA